MLLYLYALLAIGLILLGAFLVSRSQRIHWRGRGRERLIFVKNKSLF